MFIFVASIFKSPSNAQSHKSHAESQLTTSQIISVRHIRKKVENNWDIVDYMFPPRKVLKESGRDVRLALESYGQKHAKISHLRNFTAQIVKTTVVLKGPGFASECAQAVEKARAAGVGLLPV